ncbi:hypothetical protein [uncultured Pseudoteredinibacter sp.]|uniref:DUF4124 domain-containing protein n=1 Tax=uncultured Pseudoteredinibacter sp. TaxID=1641701 RepID=UPI00262AEFA5|nr:hypothetical protein [uncultured Pseudoteredinibacter sp.]
MLITALIARLSRVSIASLALVMASPVALGETVFYRYVDKNGVPVINSTVPPEYAQNGYEVVSPSGRVIRVVKPAPSDAEKANMKSKAELAKWDAELRRRYSSVKEIERAKKRKLESIDGNIQILKGNIGGIDTRIHQKRMEAANLERAGRTVGDALLEQLDELKLKREVTEARIEKRQAERKALIEKFDEDIARFSEITGKTS